MLHCGAFEATREDVIAVPVPPATRTYETLPHAGLLKRLEGRFADQGFEITRERYGLTAEGDRLFGVYDLIHPGGGCIEPDYTLCAGFRNSYDKSMKAGVALGASVFVCDNLALTGEFVIDRKHTPGINHEFDDMIAGVVARFAGDAETIHEDIRGLKRFQLRPDGDAETERTFLRRVMGETVLRGAYPANKLAKVLKEYERPTHKEFRGRNAWSLLNAFTQISKARNEQAQFGESLRMTSMLKMMIGESAPSAN